MTSQPRGKEAEDASIAFQAAIISLGLESVEDALTLWDDMPVGAKAEQANRWLARATQYMNTRRGKARAMGMAYYRLSRALRTGTTNADPLHPDPEYVTMAQLRSEFAALAATPDQGTGGLAAPDTDDGSTTGPKAGSGDPQQAGTPPKPYEDVPDQDEEVDDDERILVEEIAELEAELARMDAAADAEIESVLDGLAKYEARKVEAEKDEARRQEAHDLVGRRAAAEAARIIQNGARGTVYSTGTKDKRVIAWVRVSRTGTPCGWCAMLLSRGAVYKSSRSAGGKRLEDGTREGEQDMYHANCNCYAIPVYSLDEYSNSPLFALNRKYAAEWRQVTRGIGGGDALPVWRKHIRASKAA